MVYADNPKGLPSSEYVYDYTTKIFLMLGIPTMLKGFRFLREAVNIAVLDINSLGGITENIYKQVAMLFGEENEKNICRACSYAIYMANNSGKLENINKVLGATVYKNRHDKPSVGEFIAMISDKIRLDIMRVGRNKSEE